eukprot:EG_transcript_8058
MIALAALWLCLSCWPGYAHVYRQEEDLITSLPHLSSPLCFKSYSGYLPVADDTKHLFYWYHEAAKTPHDAPWVLWLNGGPGCSSLGGMFVEHGPFVVDAQLNVTFNPYSWNTVANILYLEQPAGVGFSYPALKRTDDAITAHDSYEALREFLDRHPELRGRPFYLSGESYAGHYVPNLVRTILDGPDRRFNLKGFLVGNAYTDWHLDCSANVPFAHFHALSSPEQYVAAMVACGGDTARCYWPKPGVPCPPDCLAAVAAATANVVDGSIDGYDIYSDVCPTPDQRRSPSQSSVLQRERQGRLRQAVANGPQSLRGTTISPVFDTCIDVYTERYLNLPEVQRAIHVRPDTIPGKRWVDCGLAGYDFNYESVLPLYRNWTAAGKLNILVYSGDIDFVVSFMGSQAWIKSLNLPIRTPWQRWYGADRQVAGYYTEYEGLTFLTVKGAGHMVPKDRPLHALNLFASYLAGTPYNAVAPQAAQPPLCPAASVP